MRVIPKNFSGFICGTYSRKGETFEGVMEYKNGVDIALHLARRDDEIPELRRALTRDAARGTGAGALTRTIRTRVIYA